MQFHVLHEEVTPDKVCKVIIVCTVFHNIYKARHIPVPLEDSDGEGNEEGEGMKDDNEESHRGGTL